ncbi:MAG: CBS/transporter associated domain protein [Fibrobacteres bacterium]|nr:CBS/transporter associated domain protein [Fibrobacterota bacterium]
MVVPITEPLYNVDPTSPLKTLLFFFLWAGLSGVLSGVKTVIGFFRGQNSEHSLNGESAQTKAIVSRAVTLWEKPGFFESISVGRFILDGCAILAGIRYLAYMFPETSIVTLGLIDILLAFAIAHWLSPILAQAFSPSLGKWALRIYKVYSFFFMGKVGEVLFQTHDLVLRKMGIDPKLSFLGETNLHKLAPPVDDENPDRSGLEDDEKEMIRSIFDLRETQVKEIMTPRVDVAALEIGASFREVRDLISDEKYSRIPVYKETIDNIQGILHTMDLMSMRDEIRGPGFKLQGLLREAYFVPRTKKIGELMREFRRKHIHMAIVVDEYGGTAGLITLEDILEEIVGEIHDEDETETLKIRKIDDGIYLVDPIVSLSDLNAELGLALKPEDPDIQIDTFGGFILFIHGKVPDKGDVIRFKDFTFEVMEMDGQKMEKIRLTLPSLVNT